MKRLYKGVIGKLKGSYTRFVREIKGTILLPLKDICPFRSALPLGSSKNSLLTPLLFLLTPLLFSSCNDEDEAPYPSIITELVDCPTDNDGKLSVIVLDDDTRLTVTNPQTDLKPSVTYRALAGYTLDDGKATLYSLKAASLLKDSTAVAVCDPINVVSLWRTKHYINLHLLPKTQGGQQTWGFIVDRIVGRHAYLRLHHRQGTDPMAYSTDVYASLYLDDLAADDITLSIQTFSGWSDWEL